VTLRVVIVDDEVDARAKVRRLLGAHRDVEIVGEARNGRDAADLIRRHRPDLVILDIRMPELDGFEMLRSTIDEGVSPKIVFVTAYDEYAIDAFDVRALDYVLKPYDGVRLAEALDRVRDQLSLEQRPTIESVASLLTHLEDRTAVTAATQLETHGPFLDRVSVRSAGRIQFVRMADVEWIEACGNYARLHASGARTLARVTLQYLAAHLDPGSFARIHRSAIVNINRIRELRPLHSGDSLVILESGMRLRVSRRYRTNLDPIVTR
jgi:two-component system LytT family response regulator